MMLLTDVAKALLQRSTGTRAKKLCLAGERRCFVEPPHVMFCGHLSSYLKVRQLPKGRIERICLLCRKERAS